MRDFTVRQLNEPTGARRRLRSAAVGLIALSLLTVGDVSGAPGPVPDEAWVTNGDVLSVVRSGSTVYLGGSFTQIGPRTGSAVGLDAVTGEPDLAFPEVAGEVNAVASDGAGGWYVGGTFTHVGGLARSNLAHILPDKSVDPGFDPNLTPGVGFVAALAVSGSTLYVGGNFAWVGVEFRQNLAAFDTATGGLTPWNPGASSFVMAIAAEGSTVYAGGSFTSIAGQARNRIAALDATTGTATAWNPNATGLVRYIAVDGAAVYAGGDFTSIGGQARNRIAALDLTTGAATAWNPNASGSVRHLTADGSTVYVGGDFATIGGQPRLGIAALDASTGLATAWNAGANSAILDLEIVGSTIYVGGWFTSIGGQSRNRLAALDAATGAATAWNPNANDRVSALTIEGSTIYAGGAFNSIGGVQRNRIAALDAGTGEPKDWNPGANAIVRVLTVEGSTVYAGGDFTSIGGAPRPFLAAMDATTGAVTSWNPQPNGGIQDLDVVESRVYAVGFFTSIGGQARNRVAAVDAATSLATAWNPNANDTVFRIAVAGSTVFVAGKFSSVGGQAREWIAALDATSGLATGWDAGVIGSPGSWIGALAVSGSTVYVGGPFTSIGGQPRHRIAALDADTGLATSWSPVVGNTPTSFAVDGDIVYVGGEGGVGGQAFVAALDSVTGVATSWDPKPNAAVRALSVSGSTLYLGGDFTRMGSSPAGGVAWFSDPLANDAPVADDDAHDTPEDTAVVVAAPGVLSNDTDADGDPLTVTAASPIDDVDHGSLILDGDGSFTYMPDANYCGSDGFNYRSSDGDAESNTATVAITVDCVNDPPLADAGSDQAQDEGAHVTLDGSGTDPDGDSLTHSWAQVSGSAVTIDDATLAQPTFTAPHVGPAGDLLTFELTVDDGNGGTATDMVDVTVDNVNTPPVADDDPQATAEDTALVVAAPGVLSNDTDADGDPLTVTAASPVDGVDHGSLSLDGDGSFSYMPDPGYCGADSFSYRSSDGVAESNTATVAITVDCVNDSVLFNRGGDIWSVRPGTGVPVRLTMGPDIDAEADWFPGGQRIVFSSTRGSNVDLYTMEADGTNVEPLTIGSAIELSPAVSPDGTMIAFSSNRASRHNFDIFVIELASGAITRLTTAPAADMLPAWSTDGSQLAFSSLRSGHGDIYRMNADGSSQTRLTTSSGMDTDPAWHGSTIAFSTNRHGVFNFEIYTMDSNGATQTRRTQHAGLDITPAWSADGSQILFAANRPNLKLNFDLYTMNADGSAQTPLVTGPAAELLPDW